MVPEKLINTIPQWLKEWKEGPVVTLILQLSRNLKDIKFPTKLSIEEREEIVTMVCEELEKTPFWQTPLKIKCGELTSDWLKILFERKLITRYILNSPQGVCILFDKEEKLLARINDRDHIRLVIRETGNNMEQAFTNLTASAYILEQIFEFSFHEQFGYLTSSPVYLGEGLSLNALLHIPAIFFTRQTEKLFKILSDYNILVWGMEGEGSDITGSMVLIKERDLLMRKEDSFARFQKALGEINELESTSRSILMVQHQKELEDRVLKSLAILKSAVILGLKEALELLSTVKLGIETGIIDGVSPNFFTRSLIFMQPEHLRKKFGLSQLDPLRESELRAELIKEALEGEHEG